MTRAGPQVSRWREPGRRSVSDAGRAVDDQLPTPNSAAHHSTSWTIASGVTDSK